jgi:predicted kinase
MTMTKLLMLNDNVAIPNDHVVGDTSSSVSRKKKTSFQHFDSEPSLSTTPFTTSSGFGKRRSSVIRKSVVLKRFSTLVSTEQHNGVANTDEFFGPYAHLRQRLDYTYHTNYRKERQWLHDAIIEDMLEVEDDEAGCIIPSEPWLIYTVGPQGAGKRHVVHKLTQEENLQLLSFVHVDPDAIRRRLPEFSTYVKKCPDMVDPFTRKECGYIAELLTLAALQAGRNVIVDGALQNASWHKARIKDLRQEYSSLKFAVFHVQAPFKLIMKRSQVRSDEWINSGL